MKILNNKKYLAGAVSVLLIMLYILPNFSSAALIPCGNPDQKPCDFSFFVAALNNIIKWFISIATSIFTISAIYGGYIYLTAGSNTGKTQKAKDILWSSVVGFIIILVAWLIVYTILTTLAPDNTSILRFIKS